MLGCIRLFNVTSANVVRFFPKFVGLHIIIQVHGTTVANLVIVWFIFTMLLNMTRCWPVILHALRGIKYYVLYECFTDYCVTSADVVVFSPNSIQFNSLIIYIA